MIVEEAGEYSLSVVLSASIELDPFQAMDSGELGFLWITEILKSGCSEHQRERMASEVMQSLGRHCLRENPVYTINLQPAWIPPLLGFLSLSEKLDTKRSSGFIALRILATSPASADFGPMILPILTSSLLPTHRLQARRLALNVFLRFMSGWFSSQMKNIPSEDLNKLVEAVGDPVQFPDLPLQDGEPVNPPDYDPMAAAAVLIRFASSDLWRNHLCRSNFTTFEEMVSTRDGKRTAVGRMRGRAFYPMEMSLSTAVKISMAIGRLEELQCSNTVEVVIMWAWTVGTVNPVDRDGWQLIGRDTLRFYQAHGVERLTALKQHVTGGALERYRRESGMEIFVELPVLKLQPEIGSRYHTYMNLSQTCQLRRLYHLFGYDPTTWKEAVGVEEVDGKIEVPPGHSVALSPFMGWVCDYP